MSGRLGAIGVAGEVAEPTVVTSQGLLLHAEPPYAAALVFWAVDGLGTMVGEQVQPAEERTAYTVADLLPLRSGGRRLIAVCRTCPRHCGCLRISTGLTEFLLLERAHQWYQQILARMVMELICLEYGVKYGVTIVRALTPETLICYEPLIVQTDQVYQTIRGPSPFAGSLRKRPLDAIRRSSDRSFRMSRMSPGRRESRFNMTLASMRVFHRYGR